MRGHEEGAVLFVKLGSPVQGSDEPAADAQAVLLLDGKGVGQPLPSVSPCRLQGLHDAVRQQTRGDLQPHDQPDGANQRVRHHATNVPARPVHQHPQQLRVRV